MATTKSTFAFQRDKALLEHLESQLKIEKARLKSFCNRGNTVVYWMAYSTEEVVAEIERQIKELKAIKYLDTPPHLRNKKINLLWQRQPARKKNRKPALPSLTKM